MACGPSCLVLLWLRPPHHQHLCSLVLPPLSAFDLSFFEPPSGPQPCTAHVQRSASPASVDQSQEAARRSFKHAVCFSAGYKLPQRKTHSCLDASVLKSLCLKQSFPDSRRCSWSYSWTVKLPPHVLPFVFTQSSFKHVYSSVCFSSFFESCQAAICPSSHLDLIESSLCQCRIKRILRSWQK